MFLFQLQIAILFDIPADKIRGRHLDRHQKGSGFLPAALLNPADRQLHRSAHIQFQRHPLLIVQLDIVLLQDRLIGSHRLLINVSPQVVHVPGRKSIAVKPGVRLKHTPGAARCGVIVHSLEQAE